MPEPARYRPTRSREYVLLLIVSRRCFYTTEAVWEPLREGSLRPLRHHLPNATDNPVHRYKHPKRDLRHFSRLGNANPSRRNLRSEWSTATQPYEGAYFATIPEALLGICIRAGTCERGACPNFGTPQNLKVRAKGREIGHDWHPSKALAISRGQGVAAIGIHECTYRWAALGFNNVCPWATQPVVPCFVPDLFMGRGTTLGVARRLPCRRIGVAWVLRRR